jgi:hypothetical protein
MTIHRSLRLPGLWLGPDDVWLTRRGEMPAEPGLERMTRHAGYYLAHAWASDPEHLGSVVHFLAAAGIDLPADTAGDADVVDAVVESLENERIWIWERPVASVTSPSPFPLPGPDPGRHRPGPDTKLTWIEIVLVDEQGRPIPRERYRVVLPDGRSRTGQLDDQGFARLEGIEPGTCDVAFPDIDGREWNRGS